MSTTDRFSLAARAALIADMRNREVDLLVIGGGIMGASVFRDAALRGLRTALVESRDFASGTSSRSSNLVHGGLHLLRAGHPGRAQEFCRERELQLRLNGRIVKPVPFVIPLYGHGHSRALLKTGLVVLEHLAGLRDRRRHRFLSAKETLVYAPQLKWTGLRGGYLYYDAGVTDYRLAVETLKDAVRRGGIALNYASAVRLVRNGRRVVGVDVLDTLTGRNHSVRARCIVNATGAFVDEVRRLDDPQCPERTAWARGTHLVLRTSDVPLDSNMAFPSPLDGRVLHLIRQGDYVLYGTSADPDDSGPACPRPSNRDIQYLIDSLNAIMPTIGMDRGKVIHAFAGLQLLRRSGSGVSRCGEIGGFRMETSDSGLISLVGGELTTARLCAERVLDRVVHTLGLNPGHFVCRTAHIPLGGKSEEIAAGALYWRKKLPALQRQVDTWFQKYGIDGHLLCPEMERAARESRWTPQLESLVEAQYLCRFEMVCTIEDLVLRRLDRAAVTNDERLVLARQLLIELRTVLAVSEREAQTQLRSLSRTLRLEFAVPPEAAKQPATLRTAGMIVSAVVCPRPRRTAQLAR